MLWKSGSRVAFQPTAGHGPYARKKPQIFLTSFLMAGALSGAALAQEPNPTPNTYTDLPVPQLTRWKTETNTVTVQPGVDGYSGASARTQFYPSELARQSAEAALATLNNADPADDVEDIEGELWANSPAAVYWELDDGSGRPPGIQVVTDDLDTPTNNCIMSSGMRVDEKLGTLVPKTCSDPNSSSKRYFLEIRDADTPVDMVFEVGKKDIRYKGVKNPEEDGGEELAAFKEEYGIGRIYRVIQKVVNNSDERWVGIKMELGHGIGNNFTPFNFAEDGVAFELREAVPREFFEGETGAPDIAVWNPDRFSTFSPKGFDDGSRERFDPGFFSDQAAGLFPPQSAGNGSDKAVLLYSGSEYNSETDAYGAITPNVFSMADTQAAGTTFVTQGVFGYMLSDSIAPIVIARYDGGDPDGESDAFEAWWDGENWRYGQAGGEAEGVAPFGVVGNDQLEEWAERLLGTTTEEADKKGYASVLADDLATQNMDTFIYIGDGILDENGAPKYENITLRVTAISTASEGLSSTSRGNETPAWIDSDGKNTAPDLLSYRVPRPAPEALNDSATTVGVVPVDINLLENDLLNGKLLSQRIGAGDVTAAYEVVTGPANGTVTITDGIATYEANDGVTGPDTFTYLVKVTDAKDDDDEYGTDTESNTATVTVQVVPYPGTETPIAKNDSAVTFSDTPVTIDVLGNDDLPAGTASVTVPATEEAGGPVSGTATVSDNKVVYTPASNLTFKDEESIIDRFIYTVDVNGKKASALITVRIDPPVVEEPTDPGTDPDTDTDTNSEKGGGTLFGCSYSPGAPFDPTLPLVVLAALGGLVIRNRRKQTLR